ncbi:uncharacterized protein BBA_05743 [Beauveria bassiana ARSEF 2860]|uniref:Uncharacterized protein n=1 Tax=Beauveria bassiana (strain ARSEF 2860) TaxID=655819 RepID=J4ULI7_BEAB2|nr:uncharacterized protein BBA_05743 [Beauveria bassiana ARSEF 2860]EJP65412.1 hypothetical protein BBA_05743 [Beauveria bassiana ARSEF 2860]
MAPRSCIAIVASLALLAAASWPDPPLSGRDFDFRVDFRGLGPRTASAASSGDDEVQFFTTNGFPKAGDVIPASPALYEPAVIRLPLPDDEMRKGRYIAFFEISFIPTGDTIDEVIYAFAWYRTNLTVNDSGELVRTDDTNSHDAKSPEIRGREVRNATIQVWKQTENLQQYIDSVESGRIPMPLKFALTTVFANNTDEVSYEFERASIDFKIQNKTGVARCDVNSNGAPIPSVSRGATDCLATATSTAKSGGSSGAGAGASSTASPNPTSKKNAAAGFLASPVYGWLAMAVAGVLIL